MSFTPKQADEAAEKVIHAYFDDLQIMTPDETRKAMEMLISKAARGIEKYCGASASCEVLYRTLAHMQESLKALLKPYVFFREHEGKAFFYTAEYPNDDEAIQGAILNIGTIRVETPDGQVVWKQEVH